ncbi:MAG TPA: hypothetical protein VF651_06265 [Gammaproteobacteria bacterium]
MQHLKGIISTAAVAIALLITGCDQVAKLNPFSHADPHAFPETLRDVIPTRVPGSPSADVGYPRLAVSLTGTYKDRTMGMIGEYRDCGHFHVTKWVSATSSDTTDFDVCIEHIDEANIYGVYVPPYQNAAAERSTYMHQLESQWTMVVQTGGVHSKEYQPMGPRWTSGPRAAQFFVPPSWIPHWGQTDAAARLINAFVNYTSGGFGATVDPRVWFYQIDQYN